MIARSTQPTQNVDWRHALREAISDPLELLDMLGLDRLDRRVSSLASQQFALRVPRGFVKKMAYQDWSDPLLRQVLPLQDELNDVANFSTDAVGDVLATRELGVLHKYANRVLLITTAACAVHCRYCFRRHFPYAQAVAAKDNWASTMRYLDGHPEVNEVILSGGDPLSLSTAKLRALTDQLQTRPRLRRLRVHTRWPVVLPERIDAELLDWFGSIRLQKVVVIHSNHANELDAAVGHGLAALRARGAELLNQAVLLRGVNDSVDALKNLSEALIAHSVLPYYLHLLDRVQGSAHFEVDEARGVALVDELKAHLPGYLVPRLARETAGAASKTFG